MRQPVLSLACLAILATAGCSEPNGQSTHAAAVGAAPGSANPAAAAAQPMAALTIVDKAAPVPATSTACNLEAVRASHGASTQPFSAPVNGVATFDGWILAGDGAGAPGSAQVRLTSPDGDVAWLASLALTIARPDVPTSSTAGGDVGFSQAISLQGLAPGTYRLALEAETDGVRVRCDNGRTLLVR